MTNAFDADGSNAVSIIATAFTRRSIMMTDAATLSLPDTDTWPLHPDPHPAPRQLNGLSDEEHAAATAAVEQLRARKAEQERDREMWQPVFNELAAIEEDSGSDGMAAHLLERAELCGWDEAEDERLGGLAVALIERLGIDVRRNKRGEVSVKRWRGPVVRHIES
jgi:hypothetical protein